MPTSCIRYKCPRHGNTPPLTWPKCCFVDLGYDAFLNHVENAERLP